MWIRSLLTTALAALVLSPGFVQAQDEPPVADFVSVREQFIAGQTRLAAQALLRSTLYVRHQVGRSRDEVVGMQLIAAESQLEKLAAALAGGRTTGLKGLDLALTQVDRVMALHYAQVATAALVRPREAELPVIAQDMQRGALHFERSFTLNGRAPPAEATQVLAEVRTTAAEMVQTRKVPANAKTVLASFNQQLVGVAVMAVSSR